MELRYHYWFGDKTVGLMTWVRFPAQEKDFFISYGSKAHPVLYAVGTWGSFPQV